MKTLLVVVVIFLLAARADATLIDLHNGLVYDSIDGVAWTQNANISPFTTWDGIQAWGGAVSVAGLSGFRVASLNEYLNLYRQLDALGACRPLPVGLSECTGNVGPFTGIQSEYWSSTGTIQPGFAWFFPFQDGLFTVENKSFALSGWAVRPFAVPEPISLLLVLAGVVVLVLRSSLSASRNQNPSVH
jgi:hypothetical protein